MTQGRAHTNVHLVLSPVTLITGSIHTRSYVCFRLQLGISGGRSQASHDNYQIICVIISDHVIFACKQITDDSYTMN